MKPRPAVVGLSLLVLVAVLSAGPGTVGHNGQIAAQARPMPRRSLATSQELLRLDSTWHLQLQGDLNLTLDVDVYDVDLFDTPPSAISQLRDSGRLVVCYFSAGSLEDWRRDVRRFEASDRGLRLDGWLGEYWLDIRSATVRKTMLSRLDLAAQKRCDGVDPDNVDGYANETGFSLGASHQLAFNRFLAREAHVRGLLIGLKNDLEQVPDLVDDDFDFAVNEQCHEFGECQALAAFTERGKPVLNVEYADRFRDQPAARDEVCANARSRNLHTLVLPLELDGSFRLGCQEDPPRAANPSAADSATSAVTDERPVSVPTS